MKPIFRNSMFGFHKEDVYNFISKQSRVYEEKIKELTEENRRVTEELENEKNRTLSYDEAVTVFFDVKNSCEALSDSVKEVLRCSDQCDLQNKEIRSVFNSLEERLTKAEAFREKAQKFDRLSGVLSSIFYDKKDAADSDDISPSEQDFSHEKILFPENDGIEHLREAIRSLETECEKIRELLLNCDFHE